MDGVLCDFVHPVLRNINALYDLDLKQEEIVIPNISKLIIQKVESKFGKEVASKLEEEEIWLKICDNEDYFLNLRAFPGSVEAVKELYQNNFEITFITKPLDWEKSTSEKMEWLAKRFKDIKYSVIMVTHMEDKHKVMTDFLIEDDPRSLAGAYGVGICIERPWNQTYREEKPHKISVPSLKEAAKVILATRDHMIKHNLDFIGF